MRVRKGDLRSGSGFTMIDLIVFIVAAGIFVPFAYVAFSNAIKEATTPEAIMRARFVAEQKMEDFTKDVFNNIACPQSTSYTAVPAYTGYQWKWTVSYVMCNSPTNTTCEGVTSPVIVDAGVSPPVITNFKKIVVYVKEPKGFEYSISTIAAKRPADDS